MKRDFDLPEEFLQLSPDGTRSELIELLRQFGPSEERLELNGNGALFDGPMPRGRRREDKETRRGGDKEKRAETPGKAKGKKGGGAKQNGAKQNTSNGDSKADAQSSSSLPRASGEAPRQHDPSVPAGERGPFKSLLLWEEMKRAALARTAEAERANENGDGANPSSKQASRPLKAGRAAKWEPFPPDIMLPSPAQPLVAQWMHRAQQRPVDWLWEGRIPRARLSLLAGDPGVGKSLLSLDIAARVSSGAPWPDTPGVTREPRNVLVFSLEDNVDDTIAPRLFRAGAALNRICGIEGVFRTLPIVGYDFRRRFCVPEDLPSLIPVITELSPISLIIFDPITAYCGKGDGRRAASVHAMLAPLAEMAVTTGITMLCTIHLRQAASRKAIYRMAGDPAFTTASRAIWGLMPDDKQKGRRLMLPVKSNVGALGDTLAFRIDDEGKLVWEDKPVEADPNEKLAEKPQKEQEGKLIDAVRWLREALTTGPQWTKEIERRADEQGIKPGTLKRARKLLGVEPHREGFGANGRSIMAFPGDNRPVETRACESSGN